MPLPPDIIPKNREAAEAFYKQIVKAEQLNFDGLDQQSLVNDFHQLPKVLQDEAEDLLRDGYPSPRVAHLIAVHPKRGAVQYLGLWEWIVRMELLRRNYVAPRAGVPNRTSADWKVLYGIPSPDASAAPAATEEKEPGPPPPSSAVCPEEFRFNSRESDLRYSQFGRLPQKLQDQCSARLEAGDCALAVTRWLQEQADRGPLQEVASTELLRIVEYRRRWWFYRIDGPLRRLLGIKPEKDPAEETAVVQAEGPDAAREHAELVWDLCQLPKPLYREFLRVLTEGGEVERRVLRWNRLIKEGAELSPKSAASAFRTLKGAGMIRTLGQLPTYLLEEAIRLLVKRAKATVVVRYILSQGTFSRLSASSLKQYLEYLATKLAEEVNPSVDRRRLLHQIAKQIQLQRLNRRNVMVARQVAVGGSSHDRGTTVQGIVEALASIKRRLNALFVTNPNQLLADILALQRETPAAPALHPAE
jgi:hypothetical protein